jgi:hypothetical protein
MVLAGLINLKVRIEIIKIIKNKNTPIAEAYPISKLVKPLSY